jgi:signal transduction histidine kinase
MNAFSDTVATLSFTLSTNQSGPTAAARIPRPASFRTPAGWTNGCEEKMVTLPRPLTSIRTKLLLANVLVIASGVGGLVLGVRLMGPSLFDRMLTEYLGPYADLLAGLRVTEIVRETTTSAFRDAMFQSMAISAGIAVAAAVLVSILTAHRITSPLSHLASGTRRIASGDYRVRIEHSRDDEIGDLASAFNSMAETLEHNERRSRQFLGAVVQGLRPPVEAIRTSLQGRADPHRDLEPDVWSRLQRDAMVLAELLDDVHDVYQVESGALPLRIRPVPPTQLILQSKSELESQFDGTGVNLRLESAEALPGVAADEDQLRRVLIRFLTVLSRRAASGAVIVITVWQHAHNVAFQIKMSPSEETGGHPDPSVDHVHRAGGVQPTESQESRLRFAVARSLVEAQGGMVWTENSDLEQHGTVVFTLPTASSS